MDENTENLLKQLCCTCLCNTRKLYQLCRVADGVNNLYLLLSYDPEAFREGFFQDTVNLYICWECRAIITKINKFKQQVCVAQTRLSLLANGRDDNKKTLNYSLSHLTNSYKTDYNETIIYEQDIDYNFIDCGIKNDKDDIDHVKNDIANDNNDIDDDKNDIEDDIPLSQLHKSPEIKMEHFSDTEMPKDTIRSNRDIEKLKFKKRKKTKQKKQFKTIKMSETEMLECREQRKMLAVYADALYKCESCLEGYKGHIEYSDHNHSMHTEKQLHTQCDICLVYVPDISLVEHIKEHYSIYACMHCEYVTYSLTNIHMHLNKHTMPGKSAVKKKKKGDNKDSAPKVRMPMEKRTPYGYQCPECYKYFETVNKRWKHIQCAHREGYRCDSCDKRFAFKNNLARHQQVHQVTSPTRAACPSCDRLVRIDLMRTHLRIHTRTHTFKCVSCDKSFVSRASYEHHLRYTQAHATTEFINTAILKFKCSACDKGYRSKGELRDHFNYQHKGETQHKCPICDKPLATRRCITRHVKRAHHGIKESAKDKMCQTCGKAFRDKKGLIEHERTHTGARPLNCARCPARFRQAAALYAHNRRAHKGDHSSA